jgi:pimeloyl-ACP methyl ester carboxylesterase
MTPRLIGTAGAAIASALTLRAVGRRGARRLLAAPRVTPDEAGLAPALDALGGEVVRLRSRDGLRLSGRWLPLEPPDDGWTPDSHEAVLLLHGYSGSVAPDLVEYGPFLRRTAGVLGLDFRGHGASEEGPTTFGMLEVEDVAGALAWLGERGITRVSFFGTSMGGIAAIEAVAILGDGSLAAADADDAATRARTDAPRPRIVAVVAESVPTSVEVPVANRIPSPLRRFIARRLFAAAARTLGADPRDTEPGKVVGLVEPVPLLLIHGSADVTVPLEEGRRLAALAGLSAEHWVVEGADHSQGHAVAGQDYERRVTDFLRVAFQRARDDDRARDADLRPPEGGL